VPSFSLITPTYGPDFTRCRLLVDSLRRFGPEIDHYLVVDRPELALFRRLAGGRTCIVASESLLPEGFRRLPGPGGSWLTPDGRHVSGWIVQQLRKLAAARAIGADVSVMCDSDVCFVRPFDAARVMVGGRVGLLDFAFHDAEVRRWTQVACELLGVAGEAVAERGHVSPLTSWTRRHVDGLLDQVEAVTALPWTTAITRQPTFSECMLYGIYVRCIVGYEASDHAPSTVPLVKGSWGGEFADPVYRRRFLADLAPETVAVMIHSKDGVDPSVYRADLEGL